MPDRLVHFSLRGQGGSQAVVGYRVVGVHGEQRSLLVETGRKRELDQERAHLRVRVEATDDFDHLFLGRGRREAGSRAMFNATCPRGPRGWITRSSRTFTPIIWVNCWRTRRWIEPALTG